MLDTENGSMLTFAIMTKSTAIQLFKTVGNLAAALGVTRHAVYQWPDNLPQRLSDQVVGAALRLNIHPAEDLRKVA